MSYRISSKMPSQRQLRVGEEIRHGLAQILLNEPIYTPELKGISVTISEVRISADLKNATAFITPMGGTPDKTFMKAMNSLAPKFRKLLPQYVHLRFTPQIVFKEDASFTEAGKIEQLLQAVKDEEEKG